MSKFDISGPAFPTLGNIAYNSDWQTEYGMSLRDYFAGVSVAPAMELLAADLGDDRVSAAAALAYRMADALLAAREAKS